MSELYIKVVTYMHVRGDGRQFGEASQMTAEQEIQVHIHPNGMIGMYTQYKL